MDLGILGLGDATEIGTGGSATVYSARRSGSDDKVAVKVLNVADPVFVERFEREGQMLTTLSRSPRIVTVHEAGTTGAGRPYLVLDLCSSSLLDRINIEETLDPLEACRVLADVTEAVADAHLIGVVHRDIKPANILQSIDGDYLVADFGISTVLGSTTTETVSTSFTAGYVAPETLGGERAGAPADIYALGATLFHMVTGSAPFTTSEGEANIFALANRVANENLPDLRLDGVPGVVCDLIELAMAKDPNERPTAIDLHALLLDVASGTVTDAAVDDPGEIARPAPPEKPSVARLVEAPKLSGYERLELVDRHDGASVFTGLPIDASSPAPADEAAGVDEAADGEVATESRQQPVAIRVFDAREFDPVARKTFRQERQTLADLSDHPRLVGLLDYGYTTDGRPFDVEVDLGEETLAFVGRSSPAFVWPQVVEVGVMVASAVEVLHQAGLYHGYLTPAVLFALDDGEVALGDYRAIASLGPADIDSAAEMDADLQSIGRTLLRLAGVDEPASGLRVDWETAVASSETLRDGPRSLRALLVSLAADDTEVPPPNAYEVAEQLQGLQAEVGIAVTPLLVNTPVVEPDHAHNGSSARGAPVAGAADAGLDLAWAPPVAGPNGTSSNGAPSNELAANDIAANEVAANDVAANDVAVLAAATSEFSLDDLLQHQADDRDSGDRDSDDAVDREPGDAAVASSMTNAGVVSQATETIELSEVMAAYHAEQEQGVGPDSPTESSTADVVADAPADPYGDAITDGTAGATTHATTNAGGLTADRGVDPLAPIARFDPIGRRSRWADLVDDAGVRGRSLVGVLIALAALVVLAFGIYAVSQREAGESSAGAAVESGDGGGSVTTANVVAAVVPVVVDLETDAAVARIENAGFMPSLSREFDPTVPLGLIVSSTPAAGEQVELGSSISLVVSRGSEPSCIGSTEPAVRRQLEDRDLTVAGVTRSFSESLDVDRVIRCVIYDDTETAIIVVSGGPRPTEEDG